MGFRGIDRVMNCYDSIKKPTILIDRERAQENIRRMAEKARRGGVRFRPHFKTHQSGEAGEWFRERKEQLDSAVDTAGIPIPLGRFYP